MALGTQDHYRSDFLTYQARKKHNELEPFTYMKGGNAISPPPEGHTEGQPSCLSKRDNAYLCHMPGQTFPVVYLDLLGLVVSFPFLHSSVWNICHVYL